MASGTSVVVATVIGRSAPVICGSIGWLISTLPLSVAGPLTAQVPSSSVWVAAEPGTAASARPASSATAAAAPSAPSSVADAPRDPLVRRVMAPG